MNADDLFEGPSNVYITQDLCVYTMHVQLYCCQDQVALYHNAPSRRSALGAVAEIVLQRVM